MKIKGDVKKSELRNGRSNQQRPLHHFNTLYTIYASKLCTRRAAQDMNATSLKRAVRRTVEPTEVRPQDAMYERIWTAIERHKREVDRTLALSTEVTFLRRGRARSKLTRRTRVISSSV